MKLSIIIVKYKSERYLSGCLESLGLNNNQEIIVVDNDKNNVGFGAGCNLGAKKAKGRYLLFLNPDTVVLPKSLEKMVDFMEKNPSISVLGPKIYRNFPKEKKNIHKEKQLSFCRFPDPLTSLFVFSQVRKIWPNNPFFTHYVYSENLKDNGIIDVGAVAGAAILVRKDTFEAVGGFDEKFFLYFEENDLCRRIKKRGGRVVYFPEAAIIHFGGKSTIDLEEAGKYFRKSRVYFLRKSYGWIVGSVVEGLMRFLERISKILRFLRSQHRVLV